MKKFFSQFSKKIIGFAAPLTGVAAAICMVVANSSPNLCWGFWSYEEDMPDSLRERC